MRLSGVAADDQVLEVGPGPGGLTRALLEAGARVTAIEKDARFHPILQSLAEHAPGRLRLIQGDALKVGADELPQWPSVVANLPYNVATPLLVGWLTGPLRPRSMTLMFQREVADRLVASPGSKSYGRLSVIAQALTDVAILMELPGRAFTPPPKVESAVVRLLPRMRRPTDEHVERLQKVTAAAFGQRRKMLRTSLKPLGGDLLCDRAGLSPNLRADAVDVAGYLALAAAL